MFSDVKYNLSSSLSGQRQTELETILNANHAKHVPLEEATHVITNSSVFEGYKSVSQNVAVVSDEWVDRSVVLGKQQPTRLYSPDPTMIFSGVIACSADLDASDREVISAGINALGGLFRDGYTRDCTHLLVPGPGSDKYQSAMHFKEQTRVHIVLPHWFDDCFKLMSRLPEGPYEWPEPAVLVNANVLVENATKKKNVLPKLKRDLLRTALDSIDDGSKAQQSRIKPDLIEVLDDVWKGRKILLSTTLGLEQSRLDAVKVSIERAGGKAIDLIDSSDDEELLNDEEVKVASADIFISQFRSGRGYLAALHANKTIGTLAWLFHVQKTGTLIRPEDHLLHYPRRPEKINGFEQHKMTITNYSDDARTYLKKLILLMGGTFTPEMSQTNTLVIAAFINGRKASRAREWGIPVVNHTWLEDCFVSWKNLSPALERYIMFPEGVNFATLVGGRGVGRMGMDVASPEEVAAIEAGIASEKERMEKEKTSASVTKLAEDEHIVNEKPAEETLQPPRNTGTSQREALEVEEVVGLVDEGDDLGPDFGAMDVDAKEASPVPPPPPARKRGRPPRPKPAVVEAEEEGEEEEEEEEEEESQPRKLPRRGRPSKEAVAAAKKGENNDVEEIEEPVVVTPRRNISRTAQASSSTRKPLPTKAEGRKVESGPSKKVTRGRTSKLSRPRQTPESEDEEEEEEEEEEVPRNMLRSTTANTPGRPPTEKKVAFSPKPANSMALNSPNARAMSKVPTTSFYGGSASPKKQLSKPSGSSSRLDDILHISSDSEDLDELPPVRTKSKAESKPTKPIQSKAKSSRVNDSEAEESEVPSKKITRAGPARGKAPVTTSTGTPGKQSGLRRQGTLPGPSPNQIMEVEIDSPPIIKSQSSGVAGPSRTHSFAAVAEEGPEAHSTPNRGRPKKRVDLTAADTTDRRSAAASPTPSERLEESRRRSSMPTPIINADLGGSAGRRSTGRQAKVLAALKLKDDVSDANKFQKEMKSGSIRGYWEEEKGKGKGKSNADSETKVGGKRRASGVSVVASGTEAEEGDLDTRGKKKRKLNTKATEREIENIPPGETKGRKKAHLSDAETDNDPNSQLSKGLSADNDMSLKGMKFMATQVILEDKTVQGLKQLGLKSSDKATECSILVAKGVSRTEKFLIALANAPFIVSKDWATESVKAKRILPPEDFIIKDLENEAKHGLKLAEVLQRAKKWKGKLFSGHTFYVTSKVPNVETVKTVIAAHGGKIEARTAPTVRILEKARDTRHVISCNADISIWRSIAQEGFPIYAGELAMSGALKQMVEWDNPKMRI